MSWLKKKSSLESPASLRRRSPRSDQSSNRTQAFSYYAQRSAADANTGRGERDQDDSTLKSANRRTASFKLSYIVSGLLVLCLTILYMSSVSTNPRVSVAATNGDAYLMQDLGAYSNAIKEELGSSLLYKNKLTFNAEALANTVKKDYPELKSISTKLPLLGHDPQVFIEPYRPAFIMTTLESAAYLIDENGRVIMPSSQTDVSEKLKLPVIQDKSGLRLKVGEQSLSRGTVQFAESAIAILTAANVEASTLVLPEQSSELDIYIRGSTYYVKFNLQADIRQQVGTFLATIDRLKKEGSLPAQYIDVRVAGRAYYK